MKTLHLTFFADGKILKDSFTTKYGYCEALSDAYQHLSACYYNWEILTEQFA